VHTSIGFRKSFLCARKLVTDMDSQFFPPTDHDLRGGHEEETEEGYEVVEAGESAGNGAVENSETKITVEDLPEVPSTEPSTENEPAMKEQTESDV